MTIPVIPGPFSFIERLGSALDAVGTEIIAAQERKRRRELEDQALAQQDAEMLLRVIEASGNPAGLNAPNVQAGLGRAGVSPGILDIILPEATQKAAMIPTLPQDRREAALGLPSATGVARVGAEDVSAKIRADITSDELRSVKPGGAAARAIAQTPSEPVAAAGEQIAVAQGQVAGSTAATQIAQNKMFQEVYQGALKLLGDDPKTRRLAEQVALGVLPHTMEELRVMFGASSERTRLLVEALGNIRSIFTQAVNKWDDGARQHAMTAQLQGADPNTEKGMQLIRETYEKIAGPRPTFEEIQADYIKNTLGIDPETFAKAVREAIPTLHGTGTTADSTGTDVPRPEGAPAGLTPQQMLKLGLTGRALTIVNVLASNPKNPGTDKPYTAEEWMSSFRARGLTEDEYGAIYRAALEIKADRKLVSLLAERVFNKPQSR